MDLSSSVTKTYFVGLLVGIAHVALGLCVLANPLALDVTALAALHDLIVWFHISPMWCAGVLLFAGIAAVLGASDWLWFTHKTRLWLFAPQQFLLLTQLWSIGAALVAGRYPDGYMPIGGAWFILGDQIQAWILAVSHSVWMAAILYGRPRSGFHRSL